MGILCRLPKTTTVENTDAGRPHGWAVPTATDIAFAVGVLALLGRTIQVNVRIFLLALAIIDDVVAVLIIAFFYSGGVDPSGFAIAGAGIIMVIVLQQIGVGSAYAYVLPGVVIWIGLLVSGAHPTLAGVVLGLITPVTSIPMREQPINVLSRVAAELRDREAASAKDMSLSWPLRQLHLAEPRDVAAGRAGANRSAPMGRLRCHAGLRARKRRHQP
jgi:NhaA family Na+:H+ antiporter